MPPRDFTHESGWHFVAVYLVGGPFLAGLLLAMVTHALHTRVRHAFDRMAMVGFPTIIIVAVLLLGRSQGWSILFVVPYGTLLAGLIVARLALSRRRRVPPGSV